MANINSMNVGGQLSMIEDTAAREMEANAYDPTQTYAKEDICIYNNKLYEANISITTPEVFNIAHWTETTLGKIAQKHRDSISQLTEKVLTLKASCTVSEKKLTVSIPLKGKSGLLLVQGNHLLQSFTVLVLVCYNAKLIEWTNANLYVNSNCTISGNANTSIKIEISTDQIVGTETFEVTACMLH